MIPEHQHLDIFEHVRRGSTIDVRIGKVPGNFTLNQFCFREGKITDVFMRRDRIEYAIVKLFPIGYDRYDYVKFPIQHLSLIYPLVKYEKRPRYNPIPEEDHTTDNIVDSQETDIPSEPEYDDYQDEVEYLDEDETYEDESY